jgi:hypothetical protein
MAIIGRLIMTRMSTFYALSAALAALAWSITCASAAQLNIRTTTPTVKVPAPKTPNVKNPNAIIIQGSHQTPKTQVNPQPLPPKSIVIEGGHQ